MSDARTLACPASLKGVLSAGEAAAALAAGFARAGIEAEQLPVADGGEGTAEVLGAEVVETVPLSGDPARAEADLVELGLRLGGLGAAG